MSFPASVPSYTGFTSSHTLAQDSHASQHNLEQADIAAIATKVGTGSSTSSAATVLRGNGSGTSAWDQVHAATDISGILGISNGGTGASTAAAALANLGGTTSAAALSAALAAVYPIGCIYAETTGVNPATTFGFGTWTAFGAGRVLVGNGTSDQVFAAGATGGESNHTLTATEMPSHTHSVDGHTTTTNAGTGATAIFTMNTGVSSGSAGSDGAHNNLQPYLVVYYWTRTA